MDLVSCFEQNSIILMEGAISERLKREYGLSFDEHIVMAELVYSEKGRAALTQLWQEYAQIASDYALPLLATTPTRRLQSERIAKTDYDATIFQANVNLLRSVQSHQRGELYVGGLIGSYGDAYTGENALDTAASKAYHRWEIQHFADAGVDFIYAALIPSAKEAAGIALAMEEITIPYLISFTIERNGRLIDGTPISEAISEIDAIACHRPLCYMTNCIHPDFVIEALNQPFNRTETLMRRFAGLQANTAALPYAELDHSAQLKTSDPDEWAEAMLRTREVVPMKIFGGCCGTDKRHMLQLAKRLTMV